MRLRSFSLSFLVVKDLERPFLVTSVESWETAGVFRVMTSVTSTAASAAASALRAFSFWTRSAKTCFIVLTIEAISSSGASVPLLSSIARTISVP